MILPPFMYVTYPQTISMPMGQTTSFINWVNESSVVVSCSRSVTAQTLWSLFNIQYHVIRSRTPLARLAIFGLDLHKQVHNRSVMHTHTLQTFQAHSHDRQTKQQLSLYWQISTFTQAGQEWSPRKHFWMPQQSPTTTWTAFLDTKPRTSGQWNWFINYINYYLL